MATTPDYIRTGREIGRERALLDLRSNTVTPLDDLWIPTSTPPEYAEALKQSYQATVAGLAMALEI